jgi:3-oxoacyl-(acyl-carrier-protein) synthase
MRRVVVTGLGAVSPFGVGVPVFWDGIVQSQCAIRRIAQFDASRFSSQVAGEVPSDGPHAFVAANYPFIVCAALALFSTVIAHTIADATLTVR